MASDLLVFSLNVRGIRNKKKRTQLFKSLRLNKFDAVCIQESYVTDDVVEQWKKEWGGELIFNVGTNHSAGELILLRKGLEPYSIEANRKRIIAINVEFDGKKIAIVNAYAPQSTADKIEFFDQLQQVIKGLQADDICICGDFNTVHDNELDIIAGEIHPEAAVLKFKSFIENCDLVDAWRMFNPETKEYTWSKSSPFIARRLDYVLVSNSVFDNVTEAVITSMSGTDHRGCSLRIKCCGVVRGPGSWHFNGSLLKDVTFVNLMNDLIGTYATEGDYSDYDEQMRWEILKLKIKDFSIVYSKNKATKKRCELTYLRHELNELDRALAGTPDCVATLARRNAVKVKLEVAEQHAARASQLRAKVQWVEQGEKNTKYFLNLEKARANARVMNHLVDEDGQTVYNQEEILRLQRDYFAELYTKKIDSDGLNEKVDDFLEGVEMPKLTEEQKKACEGILSEQEVLFALKTMKNGSSPGTDGLTTEFFKFFWNHLKQFIVPSFNAAFTKGSMSSSQCKAIITLIHKGKDLPKHNLNNWRPISLTNSDYKLLAKCIAHRLCGVVEGLVKPDQVGYIKGRNVSTLIRQIDDVIELLNLENRPGLLVTIDYFHAFDCISKDFIVNAFTKFGFGEDFLRWTKILMEDTKSCIGYNGWRSNYFNVNSGIRQGCPFSPLAFVLSLELLALKIREKKDIQGIHLNTQNPNILKILLYADDITLFLKDRQDMYKALKIFESFRVISGLYINTQKSETMWLGNQKQSQESLHNFAVKKKIKILGIFFCNYMSASKVKENWVERVGSIRRLISCWEKRNLSLIGKTHIIKTFLISQLVYVMQALVIPESVLTEINSILFRFLWKKRNNNRKAFEKVKRSVMCEEYDQGGLKMINVQQMQTSFLLQWAIKLCKAKEEEKWIVIPRLQLYRLGANYACFFSNASAKNFKGLENIQSSFWKEVVKAWLNHNRQKEGSDRAGATLLWNNKDITYQKSVIYFREWIESGIMFVRDMYSPEGMLSFQDICNVVGRAPCTILQYQVVQSAVSSFVRRFTGNLQEDSFTAIPPFYGENTHSASQFRRKLVNVKFSEPCAVKFWKNKINYDVVKQTWLVSFTSTTETRLRVLHWKIVSNIYPTNIMLAKMAVRENNKCSFCPLIVDVIEHFFFECPKVKWLWAHIESLIRRETGCKVQLGLEEILFGVRSTPKMRQHICWINHVVLIGKMCISIYKKRNAPYPLEIIFEQEIQIRI